MDRITKADVFLEASRRNRCHIQGRNAFELDTKNSEFGRRITHVSWHPQQDLVALSSLNNLFIFSHSILSVFKEQTSTLQRNPFITIHFQ